LIDAVPDKRITNSKTRRIKEDYLKNLKGKNKGTGLNGD